MSKLNTDSEKKSHGIQRRKKTTFHSSLDVVILLMKACKGIFVLWVKGRAKIHGDLRPACACACVCV